MTVDVTSLRRRHVIWFLFLPFALVLSLLAGCVTAPVQEMSDARQAIEAAQAAGADDLVPATMQQARNLLHQAESGLDSGSYREAQQAAERARQAAIIARERALQLRGDQPRE